MMENKSITMKCGRCLAMVPVNEMRYAKDGKTLICKDCQNRNVKEAMEAPMKKPVLNAAFRTRPTVGKAAVKAAPKSTGPQSFACANCRYRFTRTSKPLHCPYCGQETVIETKQVSAGNLLGMADDME